MSKSGDQGESPSRSGDPEKPGMTSALRQMIDREWMASERYQAQLMRPVREGAHEKILLFENRFITRLQKLGIPFYPHNIVRTVAEQNELLKKGVTYSPGGSSPHNFGCAVDLVHGVKHWELSVDSWRIIGHLGQEVARQNGIRIRWGGDWDGDGDLHDQRLFDPAHWELKDWRSIAGL